MKFFPLLVALWLLYRVFNRGVPYAGVPTKVKLLHALALLFLLWCFIDALDWAFSLMRWPNTTVRLHYVQNGVFRPTFSLLIFFSNIVAGIFILFCVLQLAWGIEKWRKRFVRLLPFIGMVICLKILK